MLYNISKVSFLCRNPFKKMEFCSHARNLEHPSSRTISYLVFSGKHEENASLSVSLQSGSQQQFRLHWFCVKSQVQSVREII